MTKIMNPITNVIIMKNPNTSNTSHQKVLPKSWHHEYHCQMRAATNRA